MVATNIEVLRLHFFVVRSHYSTISKILLFPIIIMTEVSRKLVDQIAEKSNSEKPWISFEFFPPKTEVIIKIMSNLYCYANIYSTLCNLERCCIFEESACHTEDIWSRIH